MPRLEAAYTSPLDDAYPGPYVTVRIAHGEVVRELQAVLDSGSDITVIPELTAAALKLQLVSDDLELHDASGGVTDNAPMYVADLQFGEFVILRLAVTTTNYPVILI